MTNTFGYGTDSTGFSSTEHDNIQKSVVATLRAGLVSLPRGTVTPGVVIAQAGSNFTVRLTAYPDLADAAVTNPLTEGVAPTPVKLGIDTQDFTVAQVGAWTKVTDLATIRSPHNLATVAADKIARLAAQTFDKIARTALASASSTGDFGGPLSSYAVNDAIALARSYNIEPVKGVGLYFLLHPFALLGLQQEDGLSGWRDLASDDSITKGAVAMYQGATFIPSTKFDADASGNYPVYVLGAGSMGAGDMSTFSYHRVSGASVGNELAQFESVGFKGIAGAAVLSFSEQSDGTGTNDTATQRVVKFTVSSGATSGLIPS
jgi:hypothetical protein